MVTPVVFGWLLDRGQPAVVFYAVVAVLVLSILTVLKLPERAPQPT
jgi:ABC-type transport system involved in cytochrome c biogenesis permease subunit